MRLTNADIGKQFKTRDGRFVMLLRKSMTEGTKQHPFIAMTVGGREYTVTPTGCYWNDITIDEDDLVERVAETVPFYDGPSPAALADRGDRFRQNVLRTLPALAVDRKQYPIITGALDYFPLAIAEVARVSKVGNDQHNPGQPLHWARDKSGDHVDCLGRHLTERGTLDTDGQRHTAKAAWRVLALLQEEMEAEANWTPVTSTKA